MKLKAKTILFLTPLIIIPVLLVGAVSISQLKESAETGLDSRISILLEQVARQSFDAEFFANTRLQPPADDNTAMTAAPEMAAHMFSLNNTVNTSVIGRSGYLVVVNALGEILFLPENISAASAEHMLRLLGEKISMEDSRSRIEINVDGRGFISYRKELAAGMNLVAFLPESELLRQSIELARPVLLMTITTAVFVIFSVFLLLRYLFIRPVDRLNAAATEISRGRFDVDLNIGGNDEMGALLKAFYAISRNLKQTHEEASYVSRHDRLTGLPNRVMFDDYVENILAAARTKNHGVALLFIVFTNLKQVNDSHGREAGDALLKEMAARLNSSLRKGGDDDLHDKSLDLVCRYGDNEFIVLLDEVKGAWDAAVVADRILSLLQQPVQIGNDEINISCSIGATVCPEDSANAQELVKNADIAMYRARDHGKNHYEFYSAQTNELMHRHMRIHTRLRHGFDGDQFFMDYQPKLDADSGEIVGLESLLRWQDPEDGLISPADFLPIAHDSGLIPEITRWTIEHACRQAMAWFSTGRLTVPVAVNLSAIEFRRFDLLAMIRHCLEETGLPAEYLELELTEAALHAGTDEAIEILASLKKLGVRIALNSYGMGHSSLGYLKKLPIDTLKIDRSFVAEIHSLEERNTIVDAIIALGHAMGLTIAADGVETNIQGEFLKSKGCDVMQGFLFCKPLSTEQITSKLDELLVAND